MRYQRSGTSSDPDRLSLYRLAAAMNGQRCHLVICHLVVLPPCSVVITSKDIVDRVMDQDTPNMQFLLYN
uniref:Uncharacterized protein n=1 Tax=Candidatus Kentrum sp. LFY TaxID=2126342 RepID=A0A450WTQ7_9GAMM|nr:MAG: hypothetical protein BECKLFY1418C_GA0070996_107116 [Candidatus Kentron sp. LFY]